MACTICSPPTLKASVLVLLELLEAPAVLIWTMPAGSDDSIAEPGRAGADMEAGMLADEPEAILAVGR